MGTTVVLVVHNQVALTRACLESLRATTSPFALCVIDNGSTDGTEALVRDARWPWPLRYERNAHNVGLIRALNQGGRHAGEEFVCFLHNDTEMLTPGWLERLESAANRPGVGLVGLYGAQALRRDGRFVGRSIVHCLVEGESPSASVPRAVPAPASAPMSAPTPRAESASMPRGEPAPVPRAEPAPVPRAVTAPVPRAVTAQMVDVAAVDGVCLLLRRRLLDAVGGFDEGYGFFHGYDRDLSFAVRAAGHRCVVVDAPFIHRGGGTRVGPSAPRALEADLADRRAALARFADKWARRLPCDVRTMRERVRARVEALWGRRASGHAGPGPAGARRPVHRQPWR
jgi:GT2 family glycosyltransferase